MCEVGGRVSSVHLCALPLKVTDQGRSGHPDSCRQTEGREGQRGGSREPAPLSEAGVTGPDSQLSRGPAGGGCPDANGPTPLSEQAMPVGLEITHPARRPSQAGTWACPPRHHSRLVRQCGSQSPAPSCPWGGHKPTSPGAPWGEAVCRPGCHGGRGQKPCWGAQAGRGMFWLG